MQRRPVRLQPGLYRLYLPQHLSAAVGGAGFVDCVEPPQLVAAGRELGMVQGPGGIRTLRSPVAGEVAALNRELLAEPERLQQRQGGPAGGSGGGGGGELDPELWLCELDAYLADGEPDTQWELLEPVRPVTPGPA